MNHDHQNHEPPPPFWGSRYSIGLLVIGAVAGYFLLREHLAHVVGALPILLLLACPIMHVFMHGGHGHHHGGGGTSGTPDNQPKTNQTKPGETS
jgi:hypothetical protein